jgi:hypothetical protein
MGSISLATLLKITPRGSATPLLYQNYRISTPIIFNGQSYAYAPFEVRNQPTIDLSLSSGDTLIAIRNSSALDAILRANNDLKRSVVELYYIQPSSSAPPIGDKQITSFCTREGGLVMLTLRPATDALRGSTITKYTTSIDFPELPYYKARV